KVEEGPVVRGKQTQLVLRFRQVDCQGNGQDLLGSLACQVGGRGEKLSANTVRGVGAEPWPAGFTWGVSVQPVAGTLNGLLGPLLWQTQEFVEDNGSDEGGGEYIPGLSAR